MHDLYDWGVKQSGGALRVAGRDSSGTIHIIRRVYEIRAERGRFFTRTYAYDRHGYALARLR